jgi:protoporphyrinogen oxidase/cytochrome b involved in lipid metabolism
MAYEYIICGAGIAGLYCALNLIEKNSVDPKSILILEKSYRVGGLIKTNSNDKFKIKYENGAGRITENDKLLLELISRFNLEQQKIELSTKKEYRKVFYDKIISIKTDKFSRTLNKIIFKQHKLSDQELLGKTLRSLFQDELCMEKTSILVESFGYTDEFDKVNAKNGLEIFKKSFLPNLRYYVLRDGLEQIILQLESLLKERGVVIQLSEMITDIEKKEKSNPSITLHTETFDGANITYTTNNLVLAMPRGALVKIPFLQNIHNLLNSVEDSSLFRIYAVFPKNSDGKVWFHDIPKTTTNLEIQQFIPINAESGLVMITYSDTKNARQWQQDKINDVFKKKIMKNIRLLFSEKTIPEPTFLTSNFYAEGTHLWKVNCDGESLQPRILQPFRDMNLFICGESYSTNQGWIEGALETSCIVVELMRNKSRPKIKVFSREQVEKSGSLIIVNNNVYDISKNNWIQKHPGGDIIKKYIGKDATKIYRFIHPEYAYHLLECLYVGVIE